MPTAFEQLLRENTVAMMFRVPWSLLVGCLVSTAILLLGPMALAEEADSAPKEPFIYRREIPPPFDDGLEFGKRISEIRIEGNKDTQDKYILMAMASKVGEVYTEKTAQLDRKWLTQLAVFTSVGFSTEPADDGVLLVVTVDEVNKYTPSPIIKITDENGLSVGARITVNNLFGAATRGAAYFSVGGATNFGIRIRDPWIQGRSLLFGWKLDYVHSERRNEIYQFDESSDEVFLQLTRNLTNRLRWGPQLMFLNLRSDKPEFTLSDDNRDHIPGLGAFVQFDNRDLSVYPTQGGWISLTVEKQGLGGTDADYWQGTLDLRKYFRLSKGPEHSIALYSLGTLTSGQVGKDIPIYMQFNLGGANSVRGWELGSREGKNQFINTVEYWWLIAPHSKWKAWFFKWVMGLQAGVFADAGTAWSEGGEFEQNWIAGGGAGLRILIPFSVMFRLDVAYGERDANVRFFISGWEKAVAQLDRVR